MFQAEINDHGQQRPEGWLEEVEEASSWEDSGEEVSLSTETDYLNCLQHTVFQDEMNDNGQHRPEATSFTIKFTEDGVSYYTQRRTLLYCMVFQKQKQMNVARASDGTDPYPSFEFDVTDQVSYSK